MYVMREGFDRFKSTPQSTTWTQTTVNQYGTTTVFNRQYDWTSLETSGQTVPSYWDRKNKGLLIPHTWFRQAESQQSINPASYYEKRSNGYVITMENYSFFNNYQSEFRDLPVHIPDTAYSHAMLQRAAANIANKGWDGLTFASELPDLKRMFTKTAKRMGRLHEAARSGKLSKHFKDKKGQDIVKNFQDLWLEGRYGWRTLAYDVRDLNDAVRDWDSKRKIWTERSGYSYYDTDTSSGTVSWNSSNLEWSIEDRTEHSIRGAVAADFQPARVTLDPVNTAWELVPYSFVVDWVLNVGETLASTKLLLLAKDVTASVGVKSTHVRTATVNAVAKPGAIVNYTENYSCTNTLSNRYPSSISMSPSLTGRLLDPNLVLDMRALINGRKKPLRR